MIRTRFAPWIVLACIGTLAGCTSGEDGTAGNTELNVVVPNDPSNAGTPDAIDIQVVEYTIACNDGIDNGPFLDNGASFDDDVTISGVLEVLDTASSGVTSQDFGPDLTEVYVWQGFMDLPPTAGCTVQLRARDGDGEVICTSTETFDISADTTTKVNVLMYCGISFQAPVGMLDLDGDFSFNVANFCPDLFVLNCIDSELDVQVTPFGDFLATACQVRFRDGDSSCGGTGIAPGDPDGASSCEPQDCVNTPEGLDCAPRAGFVDPPVTTTVVCSSDSGFCAISCDGANPAAICTFTGDTLGSIGFPAPGPGAPGEGGFFVSCATFDHDGDPTTPEIPAAPGDNITCTATTTDGDTDCNKTKVVDLTVAGLSICDQFIAGGGSCDDGNSCTINDCDNATCDGTPANCCTATDSPSGAACTDTGGFAGTCDGAGTCVSTNCNAQPDPTGFCQDSNFCTVGTCNADGTCSSANANEGVTCATGTGSGDGMCVTGTCTSNDACPPVSNCSDPAGECQDAACDTSVTPYACGAQNAPIGRACDAGGGAGSGACNASGVCAAPPEVGNCADATSWRALPTIGTGCTYDATATTCSGCTVTGPPVPGGGQCGQFGTQIILGCEVPGGVLNAQLAIDVVIDLTVSSVGGGDVTHDFRVQADNPALGTAAGLVSVDAASLFASVTTGNPSQLENVLNPAIAGDILGAFTGGGNTLLLDNDPDSSPSNVNNGIEVPTVVTRVVPTSSPTVDFNYDTFSLLLTIQASGTPLLVNDAGCTFTTPGTQGPAITCPVQ